MDINDVDFVPFNVPYMTGSELHYISQAHSNGKLSGDGPFTNVCSNEIKKITGVNSALLTHSCTAALEMSAILLGLGPGDEVIMPSYTFVSTANAFALRNCVPVFVDIRADTLNIDESKIEAAITSRTKAIVVVHYAGISCEMDAIIKIAQNYNLSVIEDAAQGVLSKYKGRALGSFGDFGALSFHETKNIICGEGGALLVNDDKYIKRAEIVREKGTNRSQFFRGQVDKYTWVDIGSSYLPGEIIAAFLWAQLQKAQYITNERMVSWETYHNAFAQFENSERIRRPIIPSGCEHNAHMYYLLLRDEEDRDNFISHMGSEGIKCVFHYVPLHSSEFGRKVGKHSGNITNTDNLSGRLVRLPLWCGMGDKVNRVIDVAAKWL